jgi:hypothetical protein
VRLLKNGDLTPLPAMRIHSGKTFLPRLKFDDYLQAKEALWKNGNVPLAVTYTTLPSATLILLLRWEPLLSNCLQTGFALYARPEKTLLKRVNK